MKKKIFSFCTLILSLIFISNSFAQEGWFWQNPLPQGNNLTDVCFVDENTGYVLGENLTFMKTTDGGDIWTYVTVPTNRTINGIYF